MFVLPPVANLPYPTRRRRRRGSGCLLPLILIPVVYYALYFALRGALPDSPQVIAHRGGPANAPENTLAAFRHAISLDVDWIELDVRMTADGALVVIHDDTVDRTTDGSGRVAELTLAQIRALDAGNGERVPTFEEAIALAKEAQVGLLPEAKSPQLYPGIEPEMLQAIEASDYVDRTAVQSFQHESLVTIKSLNPALQVCPLYGPGALGLAAPIPGDAEIVCPMAEMALLNPWMIRQAHSQGRRVFVWFGVVEHPLMMRALLALGVDGLIVDDPSALAEVLGR